MKIYARTCKYIYKHKFVFTCIKRRVRPVPNLEEKKYIFIYYFIHDTYTFIYTCMRVCMCECVCVSVYVCMCVKKRRKINLNRYKNSSQRKNKHRFSLVSTVCICMYAKVPVYPSIYV